MPERVPGAMATKRHRTPTRKTRSPRKKINKTNKRHPAKVVAASDAPDMILRVSIGYAMTMVRIALEDKAIFDRLQLHVGECTGKHISHHELFALLVAMADERRADLVERARMAPSSAAWQRATRAAVTAAATRARANGTRRGPS